VKLVEQSCKTGSGAFRNSPINRAGTSPPLAAALPLPLLRFSCPTTHRRPPQIKPPRAAWQWHRRRRSSTRGRRWRWRSRRTTPPAASPPSGSHEGTLARRLVVSWVVDGRSQALTAPSLVPQCRISKAIGARSRVDSASISSRNLRFWIVVTC
jgi:hypothetical protein